MPDFHSWTKRRVNEDLGRCLFSFALIADTHVDRENQPSSSPFPVNALANARTRYCIEDIKRLKREMGDIAPEFALHLGDLIHPVPSMPSYATAAQEFHRIVSELEMPLYLLPGNHDVGDKPVDWAPAGVVREDFLSMWKKHFGNQYQSFRHNGVKFILINAQIINTGLDVEQQQRVWLEQELQGNTDERHMLFLHYPPYLSLPDEIENYDNLAEPGRSWILGLVEKYRVEAMYTGHVHHFWYNRHATTDCYLLPSTSFTRQDYSEMFRISPTPEMQDGRNDTFKIGYFVVLVYENGHVCHFRRTGGGMLERGESLVADIGSNVVPLHTREMKGQSIGFDLRHPWVELTDIAPSGALDEFRRKRVRNDYPILALWEMGVRLLRIPVEDLDDVLVVNRMRALREMGHEFVVISQGLPSSGYRSHMVLYQELIYRWEVTLPVAKFSEASAAIREFVSEVCFPVYLSKLRMKADVIREGEPYFHLISHGFTVADENEIRNWVTDAQIHSPFDGAVFRLARSEHASEVISHIVETCSRMEIQGSVTMFMADENPAKHRCNDLDNANHVAEGMFAVAGNHNIELFVDTLMDLDRGHSVRNGVINRMCNPRLAMFVVRNLQAILASEPGYTAPVDNGSFDGGRWLSKTTTDQRHILILPNSILNNVLLKGLESHDLGGRQGEAVDLGTGAIRPVTVKDTLEGIVLEFVEGVDGPTFIALTESGK